MKIKLLIICLCLIAAAVGGKMSVDFANAKQVDIENPQTSIEVDKNLKLTIISEFSNEK